jgi:hypothetical protein
MIEPRSCGVLDTPLSRGMTAEAEIGDQGSRAMERGVAAAQDIAGREGGPTPNVKTELSRICASVDVARTQQSREVLA